MRYQIIYFILFFQSCTAQITNTCIKCKIDHSEDALNDKDVMKSIICGYELICSNNVDYSEDINESFFEYLNSSPKYFIEVLSEFNNSKIDLVCNVFSKPINDLINITSLIKKVSDLHNGLSNKQNIIVKKILLNLQKAKIK